MKKIFFSILCAALAACGPEKTSQEKEIEQYEVNVRQREAELSPLVGTYEGTMTFEDGEVMTIRLDISLTSPEAPKLPTLVGQLWTIQIFKEKDGKEKRVELLVGDFIDGSFSRSNGLFRLRGVTERALGFTGSFDGQNIIGRMKAELISGYKYIKLQKREG